MMSNFLLLKKKSNKFFSWFSALFLNSKILISLFFIIILAQFILTGIIFFQNKQNRYLAEQTTFQTSAGLNQIKQLNEKISGLQSYVMRMNAQMYRMQDINENNK